MTRTAFTAAAEYAGTMPRNEARDQVNKYLATVARDNQARYIRAARDCLHWARIDLETGDRESACWYLISAHRHRLEAAEWADRLNRVIQRQQRSI